MILQSLTQLYYDLSDAGKIARPGWSKTKVSWALCIDSVGNLEQIIPLLEDPDAKKPKPQQFDLPAPVKRTVGISPNFLWDNSSYLLGIDGKGKPARSRACFEASRDYHHKLLDNNESPVAKAILSFFDHWDPTFASDHPALTANLSEITAGSNLLFRLNGKYVHDDPSIRHAWDAAYGAAEGELQQCLVTGEQDIIEPVHPAIKGVEGAQSSGAAIVSFNAPAFCSYGKTQSLNAPVGRSAAFAYTAALNYLLADRDNVQKIGDTTVVCWADGAEPQYPALSMAAIFGADPPQGISDAALRSAVKRLADGLPCPELSLDPDRPFYILGLAPNAARISVRFFYRDSFGALMKNINAHYERLELVHAPKEYDTIPLWKMLRETTNPKSNDRSASPVMAGAVARAIFTGGLYPMSLLTNTMLRIHADRDINYTRAAIIKAYYLRNEDARCPKEVLTVALNEESTNMAYNLGRLFSLYEAVQAAANPGINSTIKDKYFNAASATPATIFPILDNLCQKHLRKLSAGQRIWYERQIMDVVSRLGDAFPSRQDLPQQGSFDLGYYHQTQKRYEKKGG